MTDFLMTLFADYGPRVLAWLLAALAALLAKFVWQKIGSEYLRSALSRAYDEVTAAVLEVSQVYADALKAGRADGKLTDREKAEAKQLAVEKAKENLGATGLKRLARILGAEGAVDRWLNNKVEAAVKATKRAPSSPVTRTGAGNVLPLQPA